MKGIMRIFPGVVMLALYGCAQVPSEQTMFLSSNNQHNLALGIVSGPRTAVVANDDFFNSDNDQEREPLATHFHDPDADACVNVGGELGPPELIFAGSIASLPDGTAIVSDFAPGSFPNTVNTLESLRSQFSDSALNIDLLVRFGTVLINNNQMTSDGEHAVGGVYEPGPGSFLSFSIIGIPGRGPIPVALTPMVDAKVIYDLSAPETCDGESIVSFPFNGRLGDLTTSSSIQDAAILAVGIALAADTQGRGLSYCIVVPDKVGQLNPQGGEPITYELGVEAPSGVPRAIAVLRTGGDAIGLTCPSG